MHWYEAKVKNTDDTGWEIRVPEFPELHIVTRDKVRAFSNAEQGLVEAIKLRISQRQSFSLPRSDYAGQRTSVNIGNLHYLKICLYLAMLRQGIDAPRLADLIGTKEQQVERLIDLGHNSHLDNIDAALRAVGITYEINLTYRS